MNADVRDFDIVAIISRSPWFEGLPHEAHTRLADAARIRSYRKNSYLYTVGETSSDVYCILAGRVRRMLLSSAIGQEYAINDLEPEEWLGEQFLAAELPTMLDARIVENTTVLAIPRASVLAVADQYPTTYKNILIHNNVRARGMTLLLLGMAFYPLRSRLAGWFLALIEEHGEEADEGIYLDVHLSQNDFAQFSLGSRQRINKILGEWRAQGIIELESNRYLIRDTAALHAETELKDHDS
jgi:CRP-like cAMP-binding protein